MATDESNNDINWTKRKEWGAVGLTHRLHIVIGDDEYSFAVDQPAKGQWVGRGWRNGDLFFYRDSSGTPRTLAGMKELVERQIGELKIKAAAELATREDSLIEDAVARLSVGLDLPVELTISAVDEPECWCEWFDICVGMQGAAVIHGCPEHNPGMASFMAEALTAVIGLRPPCGCPTPTHRMSCSVGAVPQVVSS